MVPSASSSIFGRWPVCRMSSSTSGWMRKTSAACSFTAMSCRPSMLIQVLRGPSPKQAQSASAAGVEDSAPDAS